MKVTADETSIRKAIHMYLQDSSPENYHELINLVFGERQEENNLFQILSEISGTGKQQNTMYW